MFNEVFEYKNGHLYWLVTLSPRAKAGSIAGCLDSRSGYVRVRVKGKLYLAHRIVWELLKGKIPEKMEIDHINHVRSDNRIDNLRVVDSTANSRNQKRHITNTSGVTGVCFVNASLKWRAQIRVKDSTIWLGDFTDKSVAVAARKKAEEEFGFHNNHGK